MKVAYIALLYYTIIKDIHYQQRQLDVLQKLELCWKHDLEATLPA